MFSNIICLGDDMKVGLPKGLYYYYCQKWVYFFNELNVEVISYDTTKEIIELGNEIANSEMCLSMKIFLGHIKYLIDKCDYILIPNLHYDKKNQMCANFNCLYDLVNNFFNVKLLTFDNAKEIKNYLKIGKELGFNTKQIKKAYSIANIKYNKNLKKLKIENINKLNSINKKILLVGHSYNIRDKYLGEVIDLFKKFNVDIIYSDLFDDDYYFYLSKDLYWKYSKVNVSSVIYCKEQVDGIVFFTTFPCGLDSLVNELVMRKIDKPYLNLVIDDLDSLAGMETRIESFVDILEQN